ncbi:zf-parp-type zinc finger protein [Moniliophthora roreri]|uniref:PARP-type domain-containing protein n=1 Tax=Moniliophthora roreri TaxID=221103 RepID=A0A0W0EXN5_MONRR|nr:zf-parp-type zinc finger protein [Moniliophthora roreri]
MHYAVQYASSGKSRCKEHFGDGDSKIPKGSLRVGYGMVTSSGSPVFSWQHWGCLRKEALIKMRALMESGINPDGLDNLTAVDHRRVCSAIENGRVTVEDRNGETEDEGNNGDQNATTRRERQKESEDDTEESGEDEETAEEPLPRAQPDTSQSPSTKKRKQHDQSLEKGPKTAKVARSSTKQKTHTPQLHASLVKSVDSIRRKPASRILPKVALSEFCKKYGIPPELSNQLEELKIDGPHVLRFIDDDALRQHLSIGEVAGLRYAEELWKEEAHDV